MAEPTNKSVVAIPQADGSTKWWELTDEWRLVKTDPPINSHPTHGDVDFLGTISVGSVAGLTGEYEGTFKKIKVVNGIITEFELE